MLLIGMGYNYPFFVTTCFLIRNSKFARQFRRKLTVLHLVLAALQLVPAVLNLVLSFLRRLFCDE